ncbi:hypothetical protein ACDX78_01720 [Virgibacillus oceani]
MALKKKKQFSQRPSMLYYNKVYFIIMINGYLIQSFISGCEMICGIGLEPLKCWNADKLWKSADKMEELADKSQEALIKLTKLN